MRCLPPAHHCRRAVLRRSPRSTKEHIATPIPTKPKTGTICTIAACASAADFERTSAPETQTLAAVPLLKTRLPWDGTRGSGRTAMTPARKHPGKHTERRSTPTLRRERAGAHKEGAYESTWTIPLANPMICARSELASPPAEGSKRELGCAATNPTRRTAKPIIAKFWVLCSAPGG